MFRVMTLLSLTLGTLVIGRNQEWLNSLGWFGIPIALCPIAVVGWIGWRKLVTPRAMIVGSLLLYGLSMPVLALRLPLFEEGDDGVLGIAAFVMCFLVAGAIFDAEFTAQNVFEWLPFPMGASANVAFLIGCIAILFGRRARTLRRTLAKWGTLLSITLLIPLAAPGELRGIYPGYGLWVASQLAQWLAILQLENSTESQVATLSPFSSTACTASHAHGRTGSAPDRDLSPDGSRPSL
jgi:hypothetical protein